MPHNDPVHDNCGKKSRTHTLLGKLSKASRWFLTSVSEKSFSNQEVASLAPESLETRMMLNAVESGPSQDALFDLPEEVSSFVVTAVSKSTDVSGGISRPLDQDPNEELDSWDSWLGNELIDPESWREYEIDSAATDTQYTVTDSKTIVDADGEESFLVFIHDFKTDVEIEVVSVASDQSGGGANGPPPGPGGSVTSDTTVETTSYSMTSTIIEVGSEDEVNAILALPTNIDATTFEKYVIVDYDNTVTFTDHAESAGEISKYEVSAIHDFEVELNWYDTEVWEQYEISGERSMVQQVVFDVDIRADFEGQHNFSGVLEQRNLPQGPSAVFEDYVVDGSGTESLSMVSNNVNWYLLGEELLDEGFLGNSSITSNTVITSSNEFEYSGDGTTNTTPQYSQSTFGSTLYFDPLTYSESSRGDYSINLTPVIETVYSLEKETEESEIAIEGSFDATLVAVTAGDYEASVVMDRSENGLTTIESAFDGQNGFTTVGTTTAYEQFGDIITHTDKYYSELYAKEELGTESGTSGFTVTESSMVATVDTANENAVTLDGIIESQTTISEGYSRATSEYGVDFRDSYGVFSDPESSDDPAQSVSAKQIYFTQNAFAYMFPERASKHAIEDQEDVVLNSNASTDIPPQGEHWKNHYGSASAEGSSSYDENLIPRLDENDELVATSGSTLRFYEDGSVRVATFDSAETAFESQSSNRFSQGAISVVDTPILANGAQTTTSSVSNSVSDISGDSLSGFSISTLYSPGEDTESSDDDTVESTGTIYSSSRIDLNHLKNGGESAVIVRAVESSGDSLGSTDADAEIENGSFAEYDSYNSFYESNTTDDGYMTEGVRLEFTPDSSKLTSDSSGNIGTVIAGGGMNQVSFKSMSVTSSSGGGAGSTDDGTGLDGDSGGSSSNNSTESGGTNGGSEGDGDSGDDQGSGESSYYSVSSQQYEVSKPFLTSGTQNDQWNHYLEYLVEDLDSDSSTGSDDGNSGGGNVGPGGAFGSEQDSGDNEPDPQSDPTDVYQWQDDEFRYQLKGSSTTSSSYGYGLTNIEPEMTANNTSSVSATSGGASFNSNSTISFEGTPGNTDWATSGTSNYLTRYETDGLYSEGAITSNDSYNFKENLTSYRTNSASSSGNGSSHSFDTTSFPEGNLLSSFDDFSTSTEITIHGQTTTHEDWGAVETSADSEGGTDGSSTDSTNSDGTGSDDVVDKGALLVTVVTDSIGSSGQSISDASVTNNSSTVTEGSMSAQDIMSTNFATTMEFTTTDVSQHYEGGYTDVFSTSEGEAGTSFTTSASGQLEADYHYDYDDGDYSNYNRDGSHSSSTDVNALTTFGSNFNGEKDSDGWLSANGTKSDATLSDGEASFNRSEASQFSGVRNGNSFSDSYSISTTSNDNFEDSESNISVASVDEDGQLIWTDSSERTHEFWGAYHSTTSGDLPSMPDNPYEGSGGTEGSGNEGDDETSEDGASSGSSDSTSGDTDSDTDTGSDSGISIPNGDYSNSDSTGSGFDRGGFSTFRFTGEMSMMPQMPMGDVGSIGVGGSDSGTDPSIITDGDNSEDGDQTTDGDNSNSDESNGETGNNGTNSMPQSEVDALTKYFVFANPSDQSNPIFARVDVYLLRCAACHGTANGQLHNLAANPGLLQNAPLVQQYMIDSLAGKPAPILLDTASFDKEKLMKQASLESLVGLTKSIGIVVASMIPLVGEAMDTVDVGEGNLSPDGQAIVMASLYLNAHTGGLPPNAGAIRRSRSIFKNSDELAKALSKQADGIETPSLDAAEELLRNAPKTGGASPLNPMVKTHPHAHGHSLRNINPGGHLDNCGSCVIATDAMLAGNKAIVATNSGRMTFASIAKHFGAKWQSLGPRGASNALLEAGSGSRGVIGAAFKNADGVWDAHFFNIVNQKGVIRFLDGQTGAALTLDEVLAKFSNFVFLRSH